MFGTNGKKPFRLTRKVVVNFGLNGKHPRIHFCFGIINIFSCYSD